MRERMLLFRGLLASSGADSFPLEPPVVAPVSAPADCWPVSEELALCSVDDSELASLSDACGSAASDSDGCEPSFSSPCSGVVGSSGSRRTGWRARCASASEAAS